MRTALLIDERFAEHGRGADHPESPERIERLLPLADSPGRHGVIRVTPRAVQRDEVVAVHTAEHWARVEASAGQAVTVFDSDTSAGAETFEIARLAAGGVLELLDAIADGRAENGLALVRPPGHHAEADRVMGFCYFDNIAVGAAHLRRRGFDRVAIVDWDVHHGNGTQDIFEPDPDVLFVSLHQFPLYPGTGAADERGREAGVGATLNIPMPAGGGDAEYASAFERIVEPALRSFRPDFLLVSAGFDAHERDPLAGMRVTTEGFVNLTERMMRAAHEQCGDRLALILEGGYDLDALEESVRAVFHRLETLPN